MEKSFLDLSRMRLSRLALTIACFIASIGFANAQSIVKGTVTSAADGEPLVGVTVQVKNSKTGTSTDLDGNYQIEAANGATLVFSYVGMQTREVKVTSNRVDVALLEDNSQLDDLVVIGYGSQKKKLLTGATSQISGAEIAKMNTNSPLQAMQGQLPGVNISSNSGQPGEGMKVRIRGLGTIGDSSPHYIIDGVAGDISTLNPADIESIDVLKDGASAAIYGAQAANGVILVTTKKGKEGRTKVTFDGYYGIQNVAHKAQMLNAEQYMTIMDEQMIADNSNPYDWAGMSSIWRTDAEGNRLGTYDSDWVSQMFKKNAATQSYNISVTGGNKTSTFAMSLGYLNQEGIGGGSKVSDYSRYNFRINSDHKLFNGIVTIGEQVSFIYKKNHGIGVGNQYNNTLRGAFGVSPLTAIYNNDGSFYDSSNSDWNNAAGNPYGSMMTTNNKMNKSVNFNGNVYAQIEPIKNLKFRTVFGANASNSEYRGYTPIFRFSIYNYSEHTSVSQSMSRGIALTWTNTLSYDFNIKDHEFNALIGMESTRSEGASVSAGQRDLKEGFDTWPYAWVNNGTAATTADGLSAGGSPWDDYRSVSYFGRIGWNWQEKYMVNVSLRDDGSSHFAKGHRFGLFPAVSAGWNISSENFMESAHSWLDFLKIRGSWAQVGNQSIGNYMYLAPVKVTNTHYYFGEYFGPDGTYNDYSTTLGANWGAYPNRLGNADLTWETSEQLDFGIDAAFFGSRLHANLDWYRKTTKDWLVEAPILATAGAGAPYINGGDVINTGVEVGLNWNDVIGKDFSYSVGANFTYNHNKVGSIPTDDGIIHGLTNMLYDNSKEFYRAENGHAIGYWWGYQTAGLFQNQQEINDWVAAGNGILQANVRPGDVRYVDQNHDGVINDEDKIDLGNGVPKFTFGFNINLYWKNFDLGLVASGVAGNQIVQSYRNYADQKANYTTEILQRWTGEGTSDRIPRVTNGMINCEFSDLFLHKGDFLRLSNLTLGYDFAPLMNQKWCSQARLYVQVQNLATFTKYNGMDPEIGYGTSGWVSGVDLGFYPTPRTVLFGVNLGF